MTPEALGIIKIFYCYAREDEELRNELEKHLRPLKRSGLISEWHDRQIQAGTDWEREIETHLNTASIILLLVSPDFIFSDYCYSKEMKRALERHESGEASVIPIILRPVHWEETPIGRLQALPTDGEPITLWPNRDKAFLDVAKGIHSVVKSLQAQILKAQEEERLRQVQIQKAQEEERLRQAQIQKAEEERRLRQAQFQQLWKAYNLPTEDILIKAYKNIQTGIITSPSIIRTVASAFMTIAIDPYVSRHVSFDASRAAKTLYERALFLEKRTLLAREELAGKARNQKDDLRLDVAQLTDVGRKAEYNEDNMCYVIPKDRKIMAKKGALFIVADGGGHGGEVAAEIAVDTVSNVYYQDEGDDVAVSVLRAIKRADTLIYQRTTENMLRSGIETTCVAAVLRSNIAYVANVGNSRAYLVRGDQIRQITQDHLWGTEQVCAGFLTIDQARVHLQRNKITRCLGPQTEVEIDLFFEQLEKRDSLVFCTDGLFRLVGDDEIRRIVSQFEPRESVYHLIERANENGGDDNITALVVNLQDC